MKIAIFIPVRVKSERLPEKCLLEVKGKSLLEHLINRAKTAKLPEMIVLCTTTNPTDDPLINLVRKCRVQCFRGSEKDILKRYLDAATKFSVDIIINVDGDDVLCDPQLIDTTVNALIEGKSDFVKWSNLPLGVSPCGFKFSALKKACNIKEETNTETGWSQYFTDTGLFKVETLTHEDEELNRPDVRLTLDYPEDFELVKNIYSKIYSSSRVFTLKDIMKLLKEEPKLFEVNRRVEKKYWQRFEKLSRIKVKKVVV